MRTHLSIYKYVHIYTRDTYIYIYVYLLIYLYVHKHRYSFHYPHLDGLVGLIIHHAETQRSLFQEIGGFLERGFRAPF